MKKVMALLLVAIMVALMVTGFTLAYFTDTKTVTNTFTVGDVTIELLESKLHRDNDAATDDQIIADAAEYEAYLAEQGKNMVPGRWVKKAPYVYNTGDTNAYVRIKATFPVALMDAADVMLYSTAINEGAIKMDSGVKSADGKFITYTFTYLEPVEPGKVTYYAPFWQFKLGDNKDQDDASVIALQTDAALNSIVCVAEAIQADSFASADAAFAAFKAQNG